MRLLIVNQPLRNRGDESAHRALVRSILRTFPDVHIRVLYFATDYASINQFVVEDNRIEYISTPRKHQFKAAGCIIRGIKHSLYWLHPYAFKYIQSFRWADAVVCAPGGICMGGFMDWNHENQLLIAKKLHKPIFYYGRSIGPFWDAPEKKKLFKQRAVDILKYANFVSLRESTSVKIAHELGIKGVIETTDSAFLDYPEVDIPQEIISQINNKPYVVFVPNSLIWHYYYRGKASYQEVVDYWGLVADTIAKHYPTHKIVMLPQTSLQGRQNDDKYLFLDIQKNRPSLNIIVTDDTYSSDIQQQVIRGADAIFGARYHSIVFAINNDVPFVSFSYEHKMSGLLEGIGLQDEMIDITQLFTSSDVNNSILDEFDKLIPRIHQSQEAKNRAKEKAKNAFNIFAERIETIGESKL